VSNDFACIAICYHEFFSFPSTSSTFITLFHLGQQMWALRKKVLVALWHLQWSLEAATMVLLFSTDEHIYLVQG